MKYLKNIIKNIKWFICNDLRTMERVMDYDIDKLRNVINENYETLLNKSIDNKNTIIDINSRLDDMCYDIDDKMSYDGVVDCIYDNTTSKDDIDDIIDDIKALKDNNEYAILTENDNDCIVNQVINTIINRLSINSGQLDDNDNV